jgi:hypothetical protein
VRLVFDDGNELREQGVQVAFPIRLHLFMNVERRAEDAALQAHLAIKLLQVDFRQARNIVLAIDDGRKFGDLSSVIKRR